jgi:hypothetical protein
VAGFGLGVGLEVGLGVELGVGLGVLGSWVGKPLVEVAGGNGAAVVGRLVGLGGGEVGGAGVSVGIGVGVSVAMERNGVKVARRVGSGVGVGGSP